VLGVYSKRVMEVQYRMPLSFGLMVVCAALVYSAPYLSAVLGVGVTAGSWLMMIPGIFIIVLFVYYSEKTK